MLALLDFVLLQQLLLDRRLVGSSLELRSLLCVSNGFPHSIDEAHAFSFAHSSCERLAVA